LMVLSGCGGGGGASVTTNPPGSGTTTDYNGPAAQTADVQAFRLHLWDNLKDESRCGACHSVTGGQAPMFARQDDVNLAYAAAALPVANLVDPEQSLLVTQVGSGHHCWLSNDAACAETMISYIENWAGGSSGNANVIELTAPANKDVGDSKNFPDPAPASFTPIHTLLVTYCVECHAETAVMPQTPYFASSNLALAYDVAQSKINLDDPEDSRFVVRLRDEFHNCWDDCEDNANTMETLIDTFSSGITPTQVDPDLVISKALQLGDGIVASSGGRHESSVIALYEFKTGIGTTAFDTSGIEPAINMEFSGDVEWVGGWGITFRNGGKVQGLTSASEKLRDRISLTGEYSIEAWVVPGNVVQEDANIISYSGSDTARNFTMGQTLYNYDFFHRSSTTDSNGGPAHSTADADEDLQATLQHVVLTYDPANGRRIYVNGEFTGDDDATSGGNLSDWASNFALVFGNETSGNRDWDGSLRLVAIHERALSIAEIITNYEVGVGQKFYLLFNVSEHVSTPGDSYVVMAVSQFDNYSYLFEAPFFINLDNSVLPDNEPMMGMRIGINGREAVIGQAYQNIDLLIDAANYSPDTGQQLSPTGTIIALEKGPDSDEFFLTFEQLGTSTNVVVEADPIAPPTPPDSPAESLIGVRTFDEINASMAAITGILETNANVQTTYLTIKQQLPTTEGIDSFLSSHQVAVSQLAIEYCSELVDPANGLRNGFFNDGAAFDFGEDADLVTNGEWEDQVVEPLVHAVTQYDGVTELNTGPNRTAMINEILTLITDSRDRKPFINLNGSIISQPDGIRDGLASQCLDIVCSPTRTEDVVKGACAAVLGSAALMVQ
ncbi:MAG: LamG domain-containing protein, partial [Pseudomonadota bacterium]